jgi:hypothetical protein
LPRTIAEALEHDPALVRTGCSVAHPYGWDELARRVPTWSLDAYLSVGAFSALQELLNRLDIDDEMNVASTTDERASLLLRVVDEPWPFPPPLLAGAAAPGRARSARLPGSGGQARRSRRSRRALHAGRDKAARAGQALSASTRQQRPTDNGKAARAPFFIPARTANARRESHAIEPSVALPSPLVARPVAQAAALCRPR